MVEVIKISTSGDFVRVGNVLRRASKRLPVMIIAGMIKWGKKLERDMKNSLREVAIPFKGVSQKKGIRWEQGKRSNIGFLFMRREYLALDNMRPHWVSVKRGRSVLLSWARQAAIPNIRTRARKVEKGELKSFGIYVKPHPFISRGFRRARPKLRPILKQMTKRALSV